MPLAFDAAEHGRNSYGYGDTEVGAKFRFVQESELRPQVGVYPLVVLPTGNEARGLGGGRVQAFLPVWARLAEELGRAGPRLDHVRRQRLLDPSRQRQPRLVVRRGALQKRLSDWLTLGAEVYHKTAQETDANGSTWLNAGAIVDLDQTAHLLASAGHNVEGASGFQAYLGLRFNFAMP